jgi:hypothetical protein
MAMETEEGLTHASPPTTEELSQGELAAGESSLQGISVVRVGNRRPAAQPRRPGTRSGQQQEEVLVVVCENGKEREQDDRNPRSGRGEGMGSGAYEREAGEADV